MGISFVGIEKACADEPGQKVVKEEDDGQLKELKDWKSMRGILKTF